jgi:phosphoglycolate phosphatase-like HAD superfamily hydrolase
MVGDMRYDMETGVNAGSGTCGVLYGYGTEDELRAAGAQHLIRTFPDLALLIQ